MKSANEIDNPAWEYIKALPQDDLYGRFFGDSAVFVPQRHTDFGAKPFVSHRDRVTSTWSWAIPSPDALEFIVKHLDGRPMVEIGAGNGYWANLFAQMGVDVTAYDAYPLGHEDSWFNKEANEHQQGMVGEWDPFGDGDISKEFFPVVKGGPEVLHLTGNQDRVLFLCWPPYDKPMAYDSVVEFQGDTIVYIGEGPGGCNADERFWALTMGDEPWLNEDAVMPEQTWELADEHDAVQWGGLHDRIYVFRRK